MSRRYKNAPLLPGTVLSKYIIERKLSAGGFGVVYLGSRRHDGKKVAIKEFLPTVIACRLPNDNGQINLRIPTQQARFRDGLGAFFREADVLSKINDPRVIQVWDVFEANGTAYFAMPMEKGGTLHSLFKSSAQPLSDAELRRIFIEACRGVEALHAKSLLHLDLKPNNLWIRPDGSVVVLDLGASRWEDEEGRTAHMTRTEGFAAPEQYGSKQTRGLVVKTDVYGLAASLYACIEKHSPPVATERKPGDQPLSLLRGGQRCPDLLAIVDKGMSLLPGDRFSSVMAMRQALEKISRPSPLFNQAPASHLVTRLPFA